MNALTIVDTDILIDVALQIREAIDCLDEIEQARGRIPVESRIDIHPDICNGRPILAIA